MTIAIGLAMFVLLAIFVIACLKAYHIYKLLKEVEKELIQEVTTTKNAFRSLVGDIFPEEKPDTERKRKIIEAEELN